MDHPTCDQSQQPARALCARSAVARNRIAVEGQAGLVERQSRRHQRLRRADPDSPVARGLAEPRREAATPAEEIRAMTARSTRKCRRPGRDLRRRRPLWRDGNDCLAFPDQAGLRTIIDGGHCTTRSSWKPNNDSYGHLFDGGAGTTPPPVISLGDARLRRRWARTCCGRATSNAAISSPTGRAGADTLVRRERRSTLPSRLRRLELMPPPARVAAPSPTSAALVRLVAAGLHRRRRPTTSSTARGAMIRSSAGSGQDQLCGGDGGDDLEGEEDNDADGARRDALPSTADQGPTRPAAATAVGAVVGRDRRTTNFSEEQADTSLIGRPRATTYASWLMLGDRPRGGRSRQ